MLHILEVALYIAEIVIGIGLLIFIHELGHFMVAKFHKVRVDAFSLGFGPVLWKVKKGDTEYRLSIIPLGGYVKMAGENVTDEKAGADYEFQSKTRWQRFQVYVAGGLMNIFLSFPLFIVAYMVGETLPSPVIGIPSKADEQAGIKPGDKVLEVDGVPVDNLRQYMLTLIIKGEGADVKVKVERDGEVKEFVERVGGFGLHANSSPVNTVSDVVEGKVADLAGIKGGDKIIDVDGRRIYRGSMDISEIVKDSPGKQLKFAIARKSEGSDRDDKVDITITPPILTVYELPEDTNLQGAVVGGAVESSPAYGKLIEGDVIKKIDDVDVKSWQGMTDIVKMSAEKEVKIEIERNGKREIVEIRVGRREDGTGLLGIRAKPSKVFADVREGTLYYTYGLRSGDEIRSMDGVVGDVFVSDLFKQSRDESKKVIKVEVKRNSEIAVVELIGEEVKYGDKIGLGVNDRELIFSRKGFRDAMVLGVKEPYVLGVLTYKALYQLLTFKESPKKTMSGPVGIAQVSYVSARLGLGNLFWVLGLISVSLGIFNLLPVPVLDGGYIPLLIIEKIKGKPLGEKFVITYQYVGLILLLSLVLFVTFLDVGIISRG